MALAIVTGGTKGIGKAICDILMENGISHDSSIFPAARYHGGFNNFPAHKPFKIQHQNKEIHSFPLNIKKILNFNVVYTGGGYFRLLPKQIIKRFNFIAIKFSSNTS